MNKLSEAKASNNAAILASDDSTKKEKQKAAKGLVEHKNAKHKKK